MDSPEDPAGRSGIFPRIEVRTPPPPQADAPVRSLPGFGGPRSQDGDLPAMPEGEDTARYADLDPTESDPGDE